MRPIRAMSKGVGGPTDPYYSNVVSLVHFDNVGGSVIDQRGHTWTLTSGVTQAATNPKFGAGALDSSGSGGYADSSTSGDFALGSGDWTIEGWYYSSFLGGFRGLVDFRPTSTNGLYPTIYFNGTTLHFFSNSTNLITSGSAFPVGPGPYAHFAVSKNSGSTRMFVGGSQVGSTYADSNTYIGSRIRLLNFGDAVTGQALGNFDEFRVTKGVGRYTANFTPPTSAFPNA